MAKEAKGSLDQLIIIIFTHLSLCDGFWK
ncbi:hypothetical protein Gohar_013569 [Gossypium harknessii]|uniref:Uncharacterized protein n=1 Tax=Gossypium harknessii TaxID=34285 RepID=A0A7J9H0H3_9ROSI|nr:hypothetical protein [Gossypium harknessii]